jgi:hypothetical protein
LTHCQLNKQLKLSFAGSSAGAFGPIEMQFGPEVGNVIGVAVGVEVAVGVTVMQLPLSLSQSALNTGTADGPHWPSIGEPQVMPY